MNNWTKVNQEEIKKGQELIGLKKGELQIQLAKALVRIDKAIEYLEKNALAPIFLDCKMYETSAYNDLLEILKGSDK